MSENQIEYHVAILNLNYTLRGFDAIRELKLWLDEHASECQSFGVSLNAPPPLGAHGVAVGGG